MELYDRIKQRRLELGLSQEALAHKLGYKSRSTINKIELGIHDVTQSKIEAFAKALETSPSYLMGWEESARPSLDKSLSKIDFALSAETKDLSEEEKQDVLDYIQYKKAQKERRKDNVYLAAFGGAVHGPEENKTPETAREIFQEMRNEEN